MKCSFLAAACSLLIAMATAQVGFAQDFLDQLESVIDRGAAGAPAPAIAPPGVAAPPAAAAPAVVDPFAPEPTAVPTPGYLGVTADRTPTGIGVIAVRSGGPAEAAGVAVGDTILAVGGLAVTTLDEMGTALDSHTAGEKIDIIVQRGARRLTLPVLLGRFPASVPSSAAGTPAAATGAFGVLGVRVSNVSDAAREQYGLAVRRGALIDTVKPNTPASLAGFAVGNVIVSVNDLRIDTADALIKFLVTSKPGQVVSVGYYAGTELKQLDLRLAASTAPAIVDPFLPDAPAAAPPAAGPPKPVGPLRPEAPLPAGSSALEELERRIGGAFGAEDKPVAPSAAPPAETKPAPVDIFAPAADVPKDSAPAATDSAARVRELEAELSTLRQRMAEIEAELKEAKGGD